MRKPSKKPENEVPDNVEQGKQILYSFGRCLINEAREKRLLFFGTLKILHKAMGRTYETPIKFKGVQIDLHQIFKEVNSRGGIQKVTRNKSYTKEVCKALCNNRITDHEDLSTVYSKFLLDQYELLYITEQTPKSHPSDPHPITVEQVLSPSEALIPQNSVPKAGDNTTTSTSLLSGNKSSSSMILPIKKRYRPWAPLQQNPDFHSSDKKSSTRALQIKEVGTEATSIEIPESHFSDRRIPSKWDLRSRAPQKQSQGATLQQNPDFHSSDKKSTSIRTLPGKEVRPGATSEDIQEFHISNKRSESINDVRSRAPQKQSQGATLQQNPDFHSSNKKSSSIRTQLVKEVRPGATSEDIQEFHISNKRSSSINDVRSRAPQKQSQGATLQQNPDFHSSNKKSSSISTLPVKEVRPGATSEDIQEFHISNKRSSSINDVRSRAQQKQSQGATLQQNPDFHSSNKKSSSIRTLPDKEVRPGATSEDIQEFHISNKRSSSINDVRSRAPQKQIQDPSPLQSIQKPNDLFFREQQMDTNRAAKRQKELVGTSLDGKDEVGTNSYPGIGPEGKVRGGNCDLNGKHVGTHKRGKDLSLAKKHNDWGKELSLAAGLGSSRLLPKAEQVEDKDLDVKK